MLTAEVPAGFPTLRIVFEPEDDGWYCHVCKKPVDPERTEGPTCGEKGVVKVEIQLCPDCGSGAVEVPFSIGKILQAWDRSASAEDDGGETWWPLDVRFAADRISRDGLQAEIIAAAVER